MNQAEKISRNEEITQAYFTLLDQHLADLISGREIEMMEISQLADRLFISAKHLSQTIQLTMGHHPCHFYDQKILDAAKKMILETPLSIAEIARKLTYDPSNFSKFFKKYTGKTPGQFKQDELNSTS
ncbi:helix-turn-helix domain-containing protein [Pedobacter cryoconitis]|uniref:YesN/AraC family two-component response regulator n=1 Tax=Pedobacter cryoconitis TaxID=188932 RepID=A0A7X0J4G9_9SPHI|nr:helix-turn-helix domain-containing protein [Pedobacter cryoconitis]MBB6500700.1 YesN/AraC family two-component response regulator [Pedobacter cryoconitis]